MTFKEKRWSLGGLILKIVVAGIWIFVNAVIFLVAPIYIVGILRSFSISLNMLVVTVIYMIGGGVIAVAIITALFSYGTKKRSVAALIYTGLVILFLMVVLLNVSADRLGLIEVAMEDITLWVEVNFFSNILIGTVITWGIVYAIELVVVIKGYQEHFKHVYTILKMGAALCICLFLVTALFFMVVVFSATQIGGAVYEPPQYVYNNQGTPFNTTDDTLDIIYNFSVDNGGFLPIYNVNFQMEMIVNDTTSFIMDPGLTIGTASKFIPELAARSIYEGNLTIAMDSAYIASFILTETSFLIIVYVETTVTNLLPVAINISTYTFFTPAQLIEI
ncbi:MAG: hypothetical protein EU536_00745 [Promethearchaeota archaeon]|nr:MAG: hypothetical protein EU536_00745 [Candidatus Lokiarchaeota archaeon]